jgi:hypothetical protein
MRGRVFCFFANLSRFRVIDENTLRADRDLTPVAQYKELESHNFMGVPSFLAAVLRFNA